MKIFFGNNCFVFCEQLTDFGLSNVGLINSTDDVSGPVVSGTSLLGDNKTQSSLSSPPPSPSMSATETQQERHKNHSVVGQLHTIWHPIFFWEMDIVYQRIGGLLMIFDNILNRNIPWPTVPDEMSPDAQDLID
ncbi:unnamed protein product [Lactuca saligna]|uniref:Uncharacterized protein n=1 Tax=Lactuca saligna TaxID=75948 RepID=A0AA36ENF2_LACSI|nr:unnamed protein product [Lactuca saligna]